MRRIIDGKVYDTETAERLCDLTCRHNGGDFHWHDTALYRSPKGQFFLSGRGGPMSMWGEPAHGGGRTSGGGMRLIAADEARSFLEAENEQETIERLFKIEEG